MTEDAAGRLARAIAAAFADVARPGDDHIGRWRAPEMEMVEELRARHWRDVPAEVARYHFDGLRSLTPEAFHFYLPAFLIASLDDPDPEWWLTHALVGCFVRPVEGAPADWAWFHQWADALTPAQAAAIRDYLRHVDGTHAYDDRADTDDSWSPRLALERYWARR